MAHPAHHRQGTGRRPREISLAPNPTKSPDHPARAFSFAEGSLRHTPRRIGSRQRSTEGRRRLRRSGVPWRAGVRREQEQQDLTRCTRCRGGHPEACRPRQHGDRKWLQHRLHQRILRQEQDQEARPFTGTVRGSLEEAMRRIGEKVGPENANIAYVDRGKKDAADVVIAIGKAQNVLEQAIKNVRGEEKPRTQIASRASASDTTTIANPSAEVNNEVDTKATSARQKDAHGVYPDVSRNIARASIGGRRQAEYRGIIAKHRPNLQQAHCQPHNAYTGAQTNLFPYHETSYVCDYVTYNTRSRKPLAIERAVCYIIRGKRSRKDFICGTNTWTGSWHNSPSRG